VLASSDIVIVGGGAIGAACARELAATGRRVLVLEAGTEMGQAWRAAAGMLAPQIEADGTDPLLEFGLRARDHYDGLAAELLETTGIDLGLWREGIARVAVDKGEAENLQSKVAWQRARGYPCEWLQSPELRRRWPWLGPAIGALWAPRDGALIPERLVQALLADAQQRGAAIRDGRVTGLETEHGRVSGVRTETGRYAAPDVVIAAGAWSGQMQGLPRHLPVEPVRGQMAALPWPATMPRAIVYHKDSYLLARGDEAILGSTMEQVGFHPEVTAEGVARIVSSTIALCPGLVRARVRRTWAGLRPMTPDRLPVLGPEPELPGLWYATGHGRNGILLAGLTGRLIAQLIDRKPVELDIRGLAPERFAR
jgi:glycine oxidase